jgi:hypothetical protein
MHVLYFQSRGGNHDDGARGVLPEQRLFQSGGGWSRAEEAGPERGAEVGPGSRSEVGPGSLLVPEVGLGGWPWNFQRLNLEV